MASAGAGAQDQRFQVWIRRRNEPQAPFALRFEASDGKGILRVARPGVLVDPPARPGGTEERLTASQVRASRFLHVWDGGRFRQGHLFARLDETGLEALPLDRWVPLAVSSEGSTSLLLLPPELGPETGILDDEPTWPRREMLAELQRELRGLGGEAAVEGEFATEVRASPIDAPPPRAEAADVRRVPPRPLSAAPAARGPSLDDLLSASIPALSHPGGDDDRTVLMAVPEAEPARPRPIAPRLPGVPALPDPSDEYTQIEAFDVEDALDAIGAAEEAIEVLEAVEATGDFGNAIEALDAGPDDEDDGAFAVDEPVVTELPGAPASHTRGALTEAVTVMPEGAQELAAGAAGRPASARIGGQGASVRPATATPAPAPASAPTPAPPARPSATVAAKETDATASLHQRNTTLVRHLRRHIASTDAQIAADRARIAWLEQRVAELEAELARKRS